MVAARRFVEETLTPLSAARQLTVSLHGSLAFTGKGHGTDRALALALAGALPDTVDPDRIPEILDGLSQDENARIGRARGRGVRSGERHPLRLRPAASRPRQRHDLPRARCGRRDAYGAHVLLRRRRLRVDRGRACGRRRRARAAGGDGRAASLRHGVGDAGDGRGVRAVDRGDEARQRDRARAGCRSRRGISTSSSRRWRRR